MHAIARAVIVGVKHRVCNCGGYSHLLIIPG